MGSRSHAVRRKGYREEPYMPSLNTPAAIPDAVRQQLEEMRREAEQYARPPAPSLNTPATAKFTARLEPAERLRLRRERLRAALAQLPAVAELLNL